HDSDRHRLRGLDRHRRGGCGDPRPGAVRRVARFAAPAVHRVDRRRRGRAQARIRQAGMTGTAQQGGAAGVRIDVWLWAARFFKTRSLAKREVEAGRVAIAGASCKPSRLVRIGDRLHVRRGEDRYEIDVLALAETRGPAAVAQALYCETEAG